MTKEKNQHPESSGTADDAGSAGKPVKLELYTHDYCPYCRTVINTMAELNIKDKVIFHDILSDDDKMAELIRLSGKKQVPCLVVDGKPMQESEDIRQFLLDNFER